MDCQQSPKELIVNKKVTLSCLINGVTDPNKFVYEWYQVRSEYKGSVCSETSICRLLTINDEEFLKEVESTDVHINYTVI